MILIWIILIIIIVIVIERIIICSKKSYKINPYKINRLNIKNTECYIISTDVFDILPHKNNVDISLKSLSNDNSKSNNIITLQGIVYDIKTHVSEKLKKISFNSFMPINSLCSIWNCYTDISSGNIFGNYKLISEQKIDKICICNDEVFI